MTHSQEQGYASYIFLDESGNLDFSPTGTKYFVLTSISTTRPFSFHEPLEELRYELLEGRWDKEYFHCAEDNRFVRRRVFEVIADRAYGIEIDALIIEKAKVEPHVVQNGNFYPEMLGTLLKSVIQERVHADAREAIVITDTVPVRKGRRSVERSAKAVLKATLPEGQQYRLLHHSSRSHYGLQVADYCCWAIFRKYERGDPAYYRKIEDSIFSEYDALESRTARYY